MDFYYFSEFVSKTIFIYLAVVVQVTSMWEAVLTISTNISKHCSLEEQIKLGDIWDISDSFLLSGLSSHTQLYVVHENCCSLANKQAIRLDAHLFFWQDWKHTFFSKITYAPWKNIWTTSRRPEDFLHFVESFSFQSFGCLSRKGVEILSYVSWNYSCVGGNNKTKQNKAPNNIKRNHRFISSVPHRKPSKTQFLVVIPGFPCLEPIGTSHSRSSLHCAQVFLVHPAFNFFSLLLLLVPH